MKHFAWGWGASLLLLLALSTASNAAGTNDHEISKADYFVEGLAPVRKSGPYDLTIVYFMDYQCPACRQYTPDVARVLKEDRRIRVIYRDTPLLGPRSDEAARAAIASSFQGRHEPFHHALMTTKGPLDESAIRAAARKAGVDWSRLRRDIVSRRDEIDLLIGHNVELATLIGIMGTPAFIVGERQSNGALNYESLKLEIADARKEIGDSGTTADSIVESTSASEDVKNLKPDATPVVKLSQKATKVPAVSFEQRIEGPRAPSSEDSKEIDAWTWLVAAVVAALGSVALWRGSRRFRLDWSR